MQIRHSDKWTSHCIKGNVLLNLLAGTTSAFLSSNFHRSIVRPGNSCHIKFSTCILVPYEVIINIRTISKKLMVYDELIAIHYRLKRFSFALIEELTCTDE